MLRICSLLLALTGCLADESATSQESTIRDHRKPPQEAFAACDGAPATDACAFDIDGHHVTGTSRKGPAGNGPLACAPDHPPPPPEALAACDGAASADACAFDIDGHHVEGTCKNGLEGNGPLACAPNNPPPH